MKIYKRVKGVKKLINKTIKDEFEHLLKYSEEVAKDFWSSKADDVWDTI